LDLFTETACLGRARGLREIEKTPGVTFLVVDDAWTIRINPHGSEVDGVPARTYLAERDGLFAGFYNSGGVRMASDDEAALVAALKRARAECPA
jgi:hypothetical protein